MAAARMCRIKATLLNMNHISKDIRCRGLSNTLDYEVSNERGHNLHYPFI